MLQVYIDGAKRMECVLKYPITEPISYCTVSNFRLILWFMIYLFQGDYAVVLWLVSLKKEAKKGVPCVVYEVWVGKVFLLKKTVKIDLY